MSTQRREDAKTEKEHPDITITLSFTDYLAVLGALSGSRIEAELWDRLFSKAQEACQS